MEASTPTAPPAVALGEGFGGTLRRLANKYGLLVVLLVLPVYYGIKDLTGPEHDLSRLANNLFSGLSNGSILALIAVGYTLVYGIIELINFAHGDVFKVAGIAVQRADLLAFAVTIPLVLLMVAFITQTRLGKAMRATAQDPDAARLMGINVDTTISATFLIGGMLAGAAGLVYALYQTTIWFFQGFQNGLLAFTAAVMGGIGNI